MAWMEESATQIDSRGPTERPAVSVRPFLFVVFDCEHPDGASRHDLGDVDEVRIGRGAERGAQRRREAHVRVLELTLPDALASVEHARIVDRGDGFTLQDAGALNGTRLNGALVSHAILRDGDVIQVGRTLLVHRLLAGPTREAVDVDSSSLPRAFPEVVTLVPSYATQLDALARVARSASSVLLLGETGTGKEVLARAIHAASRATGPFVPVNCGAIPAGLVEAQLFGHAKGAFSGAIRDEIGFVRAAHGGTLFLDEIVDLPRTSQAALLRVLQEREVVPVGSTRHVAVDIRVIAATHADVEALVTQGELRADLLARISGFVFHVPPLRDRREDVGLLASELLARLAPDRPIAFEPEAAMALLAHGWRHNVRELEQALTVALALADDVIALGHLPPALSGIRSSAPPRLAADVGGDATDLRRDLVRLLAKHRGNVSAVAREMGRARPLVHRWLKRHRIDPGSYRR